MKYYTIAFPVRGSELCLGYKKRGFGAGNWNGFGGKVEEGESVPEAAIRELREESGLTAEHASLERVSELEFFFPDGKHMHATSFFVYGWNGEPVETNEMRPSWFSFDAIPYADMWADDLHWLPRVLTGEKLRGKVWFDSENEIEKMEWCVVSEF